MLLIAAVEPAGLAQLRSSPFLEAWQAHELQGFQEPFGDFRPRAPGCALLQPIANVLARGQMGEQRVVLKHHVHGTSVRRDTHHRVTTDENFAGAGLLKPSDQS